MKQQTAAFATDKPQSPALSLILMIPGPALGQDNRPRPLSARRKSVVALCLLDTAFLCWLFAAFPLIAGRGDLAVAAMSGLGAAIAVLIGACGWIRPDSRLGRLGPALAVPAAVLATACLSGRLAMLPSEAAWLAMVSAAGLCLVRLAWFVSARSVPSLREALRWFLLFGTAVWLTWPYYWEGSLGSGDADWYATMLADFVTQTRAGIFPVWTGQSLFAFNGALVPLRVAPLFQHEGALLDLLTGQTLDCFQLRNLVVAVNGPAIVFAAYACLRAMLRERPTLAALLAALFLASPAVLAPLYTGDQIMTFVAMPFLPLACYGLWRLSAAGDGPGEASLAAGLAGLWLAHSPTGLWMTAAAAAVWLRAAIAGPAAKAGWQLVRLAVVFLLLASFPFLSALSLDNVNDQAPAAAAIVRHIGEAFPANLLPVSAAANRPSDYQLGYALLAMLLFALLACRPRDPSQRAALGFLLPLALLPVLVLPVPVATQAFWSHAPHFLLAVTNAWPAQRLMAIGAAAVVFLVAGLLAARRFPESSRVPLLLAAGFAGLLLWSGSEANKFLRAFSSARTRGIPVRDFLLPQNLLLARYTYSSFARFPDYFSHGYMDPLWENRLLRADARTPLLDNADGAVRMPPVAAGQITALNLNGSRHYALAPDFTLQPGWRYALHLDFLIPPANGVLQINGDRIQREYLLPDSGAGARPAATSRAFGMSPAAQKVISLWSDAAQPTPLHALLILPDRDPTPEFAFARFSLHAYRPEDLPVRILGWMPYHAAVDVTEPAWLETPRMWLGRYRATVNGHAAEVVRSPSALAAVRLDPGPNDVVLAYRPGALLSVSYWLTLLAWIALAAGTLRRLRLSAG
jgi:hypothetical protein